MAPEHSLWLIPQKNVYVKFGTLIEELAERHGSEPFEPHVTLLGDLPGGRKSIMAKAYELGSKLHNFRVRLNTIGQSSDSMMYLYVNAEKSEALAKANKLAQRLYFGKDDKPYNPHMSLMYAPAHEANKAEIIEEIGKSFNEVFDADSLHVVHCGRDVPKSQWEAIEEVHFKR